MKFNKTVTVFTAIGIATLLSACEPTDQDINKALQAEIERSNKEAAQDAGGVLKDNQKDKLISSKKIACKEAQGQAGYVCDIEMTAYIYPFGQMTKASQVRFVKGDQGWTPMR